VRPSSTQQPLVVLLMKCGDVYDVAHDLELEGAIVIRCRDLAGAREAMCERDTDLFVICTQDLGPCIAARDMAYVERYRAPVVMACAEIDEDLVEETIKTGRDVVARDLSNTRDLVRSWLTTGRLYQRVRRLEKELPARAEEMDDLRRFTDELVATLPAQLFIVDEDLRTLFANKTALEDANTELRNVIGRPLMHMLPVAKDGSPLSEAVQRVIAGAGPLKVPGLRIPPHEGQAGDRIVNADVRPCMLSDVGCARVTLDDVTEEWQAEQGRLWEAHKLRNVVDAIGAGLATLDSDLRITWSNRAFTQWFGNAIGMRCNEVCHKDASECVSCPAERALSSSGFESETWKKALPDGSHLTLHSTFVSVPEQDGAASLILFARDITEQADRIEQMQLVERISEAVQGVLELDDLLHLILTCVTTGQAFGFNRAFLFLRNRRTNTLDGRIAVGPASAEDAGRIWGELAARHQTLEDALRDATTTEGVSQTLGHLLRDVSYSLEDRSEIPVRVFSERRAVIIRNASRDERVTPAFFAKFGSNEFVAVPLVSKGNSLGVVIADNLYNGRRITEHDEVLLQTFGSTAGLAIENAEAFADLRESLNTLRSTRRQLIDQTKLAAVGRVAAHIAHEIRNPLATIGGFAHAIRNRPDNVERIKMSSGIIYDEVMRLEHMLSGIMDFSRPTRPVLVCQSVNAAVRKAVGLLAEQMPEGVALEAELDELLPECTFDAAQMQQVIINLVKNAGEAMEQSGGHIVVSTERAEGGNVLRIRDDGPGIPKAIQTKIFEPFFTTKRGGTGLGLAVCRHIVSEHGGDLTIDSSPGAGTSIGIFIPDAAPAIAGVYDDDEDLP
jgi:signal transduction histidine kinase/PAS domain-containing protein